MGLITIQSSKDSLGWPWERKLTEEEYREWCRYDDSHPHLHLIGYQQVLDMFLLNYRMGANPNGPLKP